VLCLLIDHDFNDRILHGLRLRVPKLDAVVARTIGFEQTPDVALLAWAAAEKRIVLSHDVQTMPGLVVVPQRVPIGHAVEELTMVVLCSDQSEWQNLIIYLPL